MEDRYYEMLEKLVATLREGSGKLDLSFRGLSLISAWGSGGEGVGKITLKVLHTLPNPPL